MNRVNKKTEIDKFYYIFGVVLLVLALILIFTLRTIFSTLMTAREVEPEFLESLTPRINVNNLNEAYRTLTEKEITPLDLGKADYVQIKVEENPESTEGGEQASNE